MFTLLTLFFATACNAPFITFVLFGGNNQLSLQHEVTDPVVWKPFGFEVDEQVWLRMGAALMISLVFWTMVNIFQWAFGKKEPAASTANLAIVPVEAAAAQANNDAAVAAVAQEEEDAIGAQSLEDAHLALVPYQFAQGSINACRALALELNFPEIDFREITRPPRVSDNGFAVMTLTEDEPRYSPDIGVSPVFPSRQTGAQALASSPRSQAASTNSEAASVALTEDAAPVLDDLTPQTCFGVFAPVASPKVAAAVTFSEVEEVRPPRPASTPPSKVSGKPKAPMTKRERILQEVQAQTAQWLPDRARRSRK